MDDEKEHIVDLHNAGLTFAEIAERVGRSVSLCRSVCIDAGAYDVTPCAKKHEEYRQYKSQGHSAKETAEHFGVSVGTISKVCKGVAPQKPDYSKVSKLLNEYYERKRKHQEQKLIEQLDDKFECVCGYDGKDGYVTIRCKDCGTEFERSVQSIRKKY